MSELDKFKRRLIRSVAHMQRQNMDHETAWEQMQNRTGTNCKKLWERMRALTMKKLRRLILAEDKVDSLPVVVRLSQTDWLLFDLVLAHENYDVIAKDMFEKGREPPMLYDLTNLVFEMRIESIMTAMQGQSPADWKRTREALIDAWMELTKKYNTNGRQCSPMLLQRRWYQLKELTRNNFYRLWCTYRGNARLWDEAKRNAPTSLQSLVAGRFPRVITSPFVEWEELVRTGRVIKPEDFDIKKRKKNQRKNEDEKPDVVMIEPQIETIDLGLESDEESKPGQRSATNVNLALVKKEPEEIDGLSNVQILEATHIPCEVLSDPEDENIEDEDNLQSETDQDTNLQVDSFLQCTGELEPLPTVTNDITILKHELIEQDAADIDAAEKATAMQTDTVLEETITQTDTFKEEEEDTNTLTCTNEEDSLTENIAKEMDNIDASIDSIIPDDLIKLKAEEYCRKKTKNKEVEIKGGDTTANDMTLDSEDVRDAVDDIIKKKAEDFVRKVDMKKLVNEMVDEFNVPAEMSIVDDGIEFVDDGIEYSEDDGGVCNFDIKEEFSETVVKKESEIPDVQVEVEDLKKAEQTVVNIDNRINTESKQDLFKEVTEEKNGKAAKFDLKLLMVPIIYTTKLENMTIFKGKKYDSITERSVIDLALIESKPVSKQSVNIGIDEANYVKNSVNKSDNDVLGNLVTSDSCDQNLNDDLLINQLDSDLQKDHTSESGDEGCKSNVNIPANQRIKSSSYLLQKPRNRSYHPIQLCKNPDFNTRLKRLTAGFFSYIRNRQLLSACKPMTIDLSKAFESKLINGTLYLKSSGHVVQPVTAEEENLQQSSVMPSAMPVQSLLNSKTTNIEELVQFPIVDLTEKGIEAERNKVINLRNLSEIRRINQKLLTAEVPPIIMETRATKPTGTNHLDTPILTSQNINKEFVTTEEQMDIKPHIDVIEGNNIEKDVNTLLENYIAEEPKITKTCKPKTAAIPDEQCTNKVTETSDVKSEKRVDPWYMPRCKPGPKPGLKLAPKPKTTMVLNTVIKGPLTWNKVQTNPVTMNDSLITLDTLNKMINKLEGTAIQACGKKRCVCKRDQKWDLKSDDAVAIDDKPKNMVKLSEPSTVTKDKAADVNVDDSKTVAETELDEDNIKEKRAELYRSKLGRRQYCCWARERYEKRNKRGRIFFRHTCGTICECCCRNLLATALMAKPVKKRQTTKVVVEIPTPTPKVKVHPKPDPPPKTYTSVTRAPCTSVTHVPCTCVTNPPCTNVTHAPYTHNFNVSSIQGPLASTSAQNSEQPVPVLKVNISFKPPPSPPIIQTELPNCEDAHIATQNENMLKSLGNEVNLLVPRNTTCNQPIKKYIVPVLDSHKGNSHRKIFIDGSLKNPIINVPAPKKNERVMFLNSSNIESKPKESPIFLGKNKILLTTTKFPPNFDGQQNPPSVQPAKIIPAIPLPNGVQLALMDDGNLQFTLEPGVQLNEAEMNLLPLILASVQQQIDSAKSGVNVSNISDFVDITEDDDKNSPTANSGLSTTESMVNLLCSETVPIATDTLNSNNSGTITANETNVESVTVECNSSEVIVEDTANDLNSSKGSEIISVTETENNDVEEKKQKVNDASVGTRNLLSDLMEMSGISAEDVVTSQPHESVHEDIGGKVQGNAGQIGHSEVTPQVPNLEGNLAQINPVGLTSSKVSIPVITQDTNKSDVLPELTPVTSLAELRYACEHNGKFFKLDFITGVLVPINVQIKKKVISKSNFTAPKGVIDLTGDIADVSAPKETTEIDTVEIKNSTQTSPVKPLRLFRSNMKTRPILISKAKPNQLIKNLQTMPVIRKCKRKQDFRKIEARIDLADSDAPMEEEYLVDSSDSDAPPPAAIRKRTSQPTSEADDSSDDEPLAKKSLRIRENDSDVNKAVPAAEPEKAESIKDNIEQESGRVNIACVDIPKEAQLVPIDPPKVPAEIELDKVEDEIGSDEENMDVDDTISSQIAFLEGNDESPEEDCILGV